MPSRSALSVSLTPELTGFIEHCLGSGRYRSASEVIREALRLLQQRTPSKAADANAALLLRLTDRISSLAEARRIMSEAVFLLGSHLEADRAGYAEIGGDGEHFTVGASWAAGEMPDLSGQHRLLDFGPAFIARLRRGEALIINDAAAEPVASDVPGAAGRPVAFARRAAISVPLVKDGKLRAVLYLHQHEPRAWSEDDIALVNDVAQRTWAAVERARAETALRQSELRFHGIFDSTFEFIGLLSTDGVILEINRAALGFFGTPREQLIGQPFWTSACWSEAPDPDASARLQAAIGQAATGEQVRHKETIRRAGGRLAEVEFSIRPLRDSSGTVIYLVPEGRDVTVEHQALAALRESEERFRALADAVPQMVWANDVQGNVIYCNARLLAFIGLPQGLKEVSWTELVHPDDRAAATAHRRETLLTGQPYEREYRFRRYDGTYRWILARALPVRDSIGNIKNWFGTGTDISEIINAREVLEQSHDELERLVEERTRALEDAAHELAAEMRRREELQTNILQAQKLEALGQITSGVAHDFANILTAISGSYMLLRRRLEEPALTHFLDTGEMAVERARKLIDQLLSFIRREKLSPKLLRLPIVLANAMDLIRHAAGSDVACELHIASDIHGVLADAHQLEVALLNLATNARDAMQGHGTLTISAANHSLAVDSAQLRAGDYVSITVRDTGQGMPPEILARAAETFFTTKPEGQGTGLGLPMVYSFAARMGGCINIESQPGAGTAVEIILPRAPVEALAPEEREPAAPDPALHGDATILLADDDDQLRQVTAAFLRDLGYTVLEANNAETAMALVRTLRQLDLLLTDIFMPGASGIMLALRLRTDWPGLPVQFITGYPPPPELAGEAVLTKPFTFTALSSAVLERLGRWTSPESGSDRLLKRLQTPALRQLYLNWQTAKAADAALPRLDRLDPVRFGLGPHAFTVEVETQAPLSFRFLSVGHALTIRLGRPLNGTPILSGPEAEEVLGELHATYRRCARHRVPVYQSARFDFGDGSPLHLERLVLPASNDGETITHLVGIAYFSEPKPPAVITTNEGK